MPASPRPRPNARRARRASAAGTVAALLALAAVTTAAAPGVIRLSPGDTLSALAVRHGTTVAELRAANGLAPGETIYAGKELILPGGTAAPTASGTHVVSSGETVTAIAGRYGTTVSAVLAANGLSMGSLLQPGQQLSVPGSGGGSSEPATSTPVAGGVAESAAQHRAELARRDVPSKDEVRAMIGAAARRYGVDPSLALAIAYQESGFQQRVVSGVDAIGAMQVLPRTGRGLERDAGRPLDLLRAEDNVTAGVLLLRQLQRSQGSADAVLAGYYQGVGSVAAKGVLPQTRQYIANINALRERFRDG